MQLDGRTAIITGGGQGIARAVAPVLAERGARVVVTGQTRQSLMRSSPSCGTGEGTGVTVLYFDGCPNWQVTDERLREALALAGRDEVRVERRLVSTLEEAASAGFRGSPTVLVNGQDPVADRNAPVGLSCQVFRTDAGLAGSPTVEQLLAVLS